MARPRKHDDRVNTAIRFPPELHARLVAEAEARALSMNWLVNRAVIEFLDNLIPIDEVVLTRPKGQA